MNMQKEQHEQIEMLFRSAYYYFVQPEHPFQDFYE